MSAIAWYWDPQAWRLIGLKFLPWLAGLSLAWEIAQLPLYTLWTEATPGYIAFSVAHCTLGDVLIGTAALLLALVLVRAMALDTWPWRHIAVLAALLGAAYTVFSEWANTAILGSWAYAPSMPRIDLGGIEMGLSPLLQWLVLPPLAVYLTRRHAADRSSRSRKSS